MRSFAGRWSKHKSKLNMRKPSLPPPVLHCEAQTFGYETVTESFWSHWGKLVAVVAPSHARGFSLVIIRLFSWAAQSVTSMHRAVCMLQHDVSFEHCKEGPTDIDRKSMQGCKRTRTFALDTGMYIQLATHLRTHVLRAHIPGYSCTQSDRHMHMQASVQTQP